MDKAEHAHPQFSLTHGGPLFLLLRSSLLVGPRRNPALWPGLALAAAMWAPMMLLAFVHWLGTRHVDAVVRDPAVHARLLFAIPIFFLAESLLEERCHSSFEHVVHGYARRKVSATSLVESAERLRNSRLAEIIMLAMALTAGQSTLWGMTGGSGTMRGVEIGRTVTASFVWYATVALPLFQFLLLRSLYRWAIWSRTVVAMTRIELDLVPTHPDMAGGIGLISEPVEAFALIVLAGSSVIAATWGYRIALHDLDPKHFASPFALLVVVSMLLAFGPLLLFSFRLWRARLEGIRQYGNFARLYTQQFHERWIARGDENALLAGADLQGLADLGNSFEKLERMRFVPFELRTAITVFAATFAPMLPLLAMVEPLPELFAALGRALLGGLVR